MKTEKKSTPAAERLGPVRLATLRAVWKDPGRKQQEEVDFATADAIRQGRESMD